MFLRSVVRLNPNMPTTIPVLRVLKGARRGRENKYCSRPRRTSNNSIVVVARKQLSRVRLDQFNVLKNKGRLVAAARSFPSLYARFIRERSALIRLSATICADQLSIQLTEPGNSRESVTPSAGTQAKSERNPCSAVKNKINADEEPDHPESRGGPLR